MKRLFDFLASVFGLLLLSPLFVIMALWVKIDSKGPAFYKQVRVGRNNKDFFLYKFRSMRLNSDAKGLLTVGGRDPRITRSGFYIRKYKIDELPQLLNVLKGEMSLVGPRPEVRKYVDMYNETQRKVLLVRPGITDVASIKYRNENDILSAQKDPEKYYIEHIMPDKLNLNIEYIAQRSFWKDMKVIMVTCGISTNIYK